MKSKISRLLVLLVPVIWCHFAQIISAQDNRPLVYAGPDRSVIIGGKTFLNGTVKLVNPVTSLAEWIDPIPSMEQVIHSVSAAFGKEFNYEIIFQESAPAV